MADVVEATEEVFLAKGSGRMVLRCHPSPGFTPGIVPSFMPCLPMSSRRGLLG